MTAKEFLQRAREADREIDRIVERLERTRAMVESGRMSRITGMPRGGAQDWTRTADQLIELERVVNARMRELIRWKLAAIDAIRSVDKARLRRVLELYYIDGYSWEDVAKRMRLCVRHVQRLHGLALLKVKVPEEVENSN